MKFLQNWVSPLWIFSRSRPRWNMWGGPIKIAKKTFLRKFILEEVFIILSVRGKAQMGQMGRAKTKVFFLFFFLNTDSLKDSPTHCIFFRPVDHRWRGAKGGAFVSSPPPYVRHCLWDRPVVALWIRCRSSNLEAWVRIWPWNRFRRGFICFWAKKWNFFGTKKIFILPRRVRNVQ